MKDTLKVSAGIALILAGASMIGWAGAEAIASEEVPDPCGLMVVICEGEKETVVQVTAYNSVPWQTDDTPCIGADGSDLCQRRAKGESVCATNDWPLGAEIGLLGGANGRCVVRDRMNARYTGKGRIDVFMGYDVEGARAFGLRRAVIYGL